MIRALLIAGLIAGGILAKTVEITSDTFEASQKELISKFIGNVTFKSDNERLKADKVFLYFDKNKKPIKVEAIGYVRFFITDRGKSYEGEAARVVFYPKKKEYILYGNVKVIQKPGKKILYAEEIHIDLVNSKLVVKGKEKKPVKMIFSVDE